MAFIRSRRGFLMGAGALGFVPLRGAETHRNTGEIRLAVATYSLREFRRDLAIKMMKDMDHRCGVCIDAGHAARAGADVVESIREAGPRLFDMHIKDLRSLAKDTGCVVGEGVLPIVGVFKELRKMNYGGTVSLEYEID